MGCINRNSTEFKYLMDKYNLNDTKLEHIVHKYWIEVGSEEDFPSDVYIKAQLGNAQYMESSESVREVWNTLYSKPAKYNSREQLDNALREAAKYFPQDAIVYYKDKFDKYVLAVRKPVAKTESSIDNFLELLNIPERAGVKRIVRRGIASNGWNFREMSAEEIRNTVSEYISNEVKDADKAQKLQEQLASIKDDDLYEDLLVAEQEWDDYQMLQKQSNNEDNEVQFAVGQSSTPSTNNLQQVGELQNVDLGLGLEQTPTDIEPQEFYTRESVSDYVQNLVDNEHINRKYINVVHIPATDTTDDYWRVTVNIPKAHSANQNPATMSGWEVWKHVASFAEPMGERPVTYIPTGKEKQQYMVKNGHIYNKEGKEVFTNDSKDRNKILANLAILEDRAVVVTYRDKSYVVDNNRQITSVTTGDIMKWDNENGDRKAILNEAEKKFRVRLQEHQQRNTETMPQLPAHMTMQGITVHDRTDMAEFLKSHDITNLQQDIGGFISKSSLPKGELPKLSENLILRLGNKTEYGYVIRTANYEYVVNYKGEGEFDIIAYNKINKTIHEQYDRKRGQIPNAINQLSGGNEIAEGEYNSDNYNVTDREADGYHAGLDKETPQGESKQAQSDAGSQEHQRWITVKHDSILNRISFVSVDKDGNIIDDSITSQFITSQGEVYGFVTKDGKIYLDETIISPNHAIHEYTHLWDRAVQSRNPKLWNRGVGLMKQLDLWKEVENSDQYGKVWKAKNIIGDRLENLIASEVHARLVGPQGEALLNRIAREKGSQGIIGKLKQWILDFWKDVKATFSNWSDEEINNLTLDDFNKMTVRDFADTIKLNEQPQQQPTPSNPTLEQFKKDIDLLSGYYEGGGRVLSDDLPSITKELDDKLEDYFLGGGELSILDYRELWKLIEFYDEGGERRFRGRAKPTKESINSITQKHQGNWSRQEAENNPRTLYVFTDNTDRDSGSGVIPADSWYSKKYGEGHHFPTMTAAIVRGLDNSRPISTQRWYHNGAKGVNGRWTDADVEEFKQVIKEELEEIVKEFNTGKYDNIMFPDGDGLFNTSISNITKARTPRLYQALADLLHEYGFDKLIPSDVTTQNAQQQQSQNTEEQRLFIPLSIVPINNNPHDMVKASMSNKFIGFADELLGSHTAEYARQIGDKANSGNYTADDVVFVSIENTAGLADARHREQDKTIEEATKAINAGATLITEGLAATAGERNEGDMKLAKALQGTGATYEERVVYGQVIGVWKKNVQENAPQEQSFTAVLPNYNRLYNGTEDTVVDAQWKIQYLEELDAQLKDDNTEEQNDDIADQMSDVMDALSEKDYLISIGSKENKQMKRVLKEYDKLNQQIDNLRGGSKKFGNRTIKLGATETRELAEQVMNSISDELTRLQDVDGALKEDFPEINTTENPSTVSRRELVEIIGINNLLAWAKRQIGPESGRYHNLEMRAKAGLAIENFDALVVLGADIFVMNEGFGIQKDYSSESSFKTSEAEVEIDPEDIDSYKDADTINEVEGDAQEHWQVEARTVDTFNSMSQLMRMAIHQCYLLDNDGNKILDKWGIPQRVNPKDAVQSILKWMQNAFDIYEMTDILKQKSETKPWVKQLLDRLNKEDGSEADFQSQFYSTFRKSFQTYAIVRKENGKFKAVVVNDHPARKAAMENIQSQFKIGMHPLFTKSGVNQEYFSVLQRANNELKLMLALLNKRIKGDTRTEFSEEDRNKAIANLSAASRVLGHDITEEDLGPMLNERNIRDMIVQLGYIIGALNNDMKDKKADPKKEFNPFSSENGFSSNLRKFLTPITDSLEETYPNTVFENGKMYQSFVTPSFLSTLMAKLSEARNANTPEAQRKFMDWIEENYGYSKWFKKGDGAFAWRNPWIRKLIQTIGNGKDVMNHKVELNFNKHNYMRNMTQGEYAISIIANYFSEKYKPEDTEVLAWFKVPMMSNKPSCEYIKFYSYRGNDYKSKIVDGLFDVFLQEVDRIQTVNSKNLSKGDKGFIKNFSDKGKKFHFLPNFNKFLNDTATGRLAELLRKKVKGEEVLTADEIVELTNLVKAEIKSYMDMRTAEILAVWQRQGIVDAAKDVDKIAPNGTEEELMQNLENFIWNDFFASTNILQITITDIAFYKDSDDLQKRLAELHAPGMRANKYATDYRGEKVSDGYYRTAILKDFDSFISNVIANIEEVFDRKIARAPESEKAALKALKENLVGKDGKYRKINVADAQGLTSPTAYRKKALMFGKWSQAAEDVYNRVIKGEANLADIKTAFQPLKPFVYGHMRKNVGNDVSPIQDMPIPFQAKNSEYLLIMADALIQGEKAPLSRPNLLRAIYHAMEDSGELMKAAEGKDKKSNATKGIDTIQFESAIKSGLQTPINVHQYLDNESLGISTKEAEQRAYYEILNSIFKEEYKEGENGERERVYREYDTDNVVAVTSYDNFCLQQEVPEHFQEHQQVHGSQERMIIPSDLTPLIDPTGNPADESNINWYTYGDIKMRAGDLRKDYEKTISDNIEQSISELARRLKIDSSNRKMRNIALSRLLQEEIVNSPRYGIDMFQACSLNKDGEFRIPKGDPIQAKRIEQLINSIIKNSVNKQEIAGGPIVQVANFGTSRDLHIRFNVRSGGILLLEKEWDAQPEHEAHKKYKTYDEYKKAEQAGMAYYEVFIPVWDEELFAKFRKQDGSIDIEAIEATDPELLMMVSYRIPTEEKYSCAPQKAVGFMPKEAGSAIMLPQELTEIDDSDFDVDKRYVMRKEYDIKTRRTGEIRKMLTEAAINSYANAHNGMTREEERQLKEQISMFLDNPDVLGHTDDRLMQWLHSIYRKVAYYTEQNDVRKQRNNHIIDLSLAVLQNEFTAELILNPGGFDNVKKAAYMVAAYKAEQGKTPWEELEKLSVDAIKEKVKTDRLLTWVDSQLYYYKQNAAAASLVGVFAVNKTAHATLEGDNILMGVKDLYQGKGRARGFVPFKVLGKTFNERIPVDNTFGENGLLIGKTLGSLIPSATDAAKEPCLDHINVSMTTASILTSLVRFGMPLEDAALFMGQDIILSILEEFDKGKLTKFKTLDDIITARIKKLQDKLKIDDRSPLNNEELTREQALLGLLSSDAIGVKDKTEYDKTQYKVLVNFRKLKNLANGMRNLTFSTRFNSIASAVGPLIIDNLILEYKMEKFTDNGTGTGFYNADGQPIDINWVFERHPILKSFSKAVGIASFMFRDMPAGSQEFRNVLDALPEKLRDKVLTDKKLLSALSDFFQSYLAVASGLVNPSDLKYYIDQFPKEFVKEAKAKYPNNKLVQDIKSKTVESSGRLILQLPITGLSEQEREVYRNAWTDLHNEDSGLSHKLFNYCFFRAGIGFSPKTFMSLVSLFVKENLATELEDGRKVFYVDTYRNFPAINSSSLEVIVDQFVRNNWNNSSLVPQKGGKGTYYQVDLENGVLNAAAESDLAALSGIKYFKTEIDKKMYLWKLRGTEEENETVRTYDLITPLGNNGEYFEISADAIKEAMTKTDEIKTDEENPIDDSNMDNFETSQEQEADEHLPSDKITEIEVEDFIDGMVDYWKSRNINQDREQAVKQYKKMKAHPEQWGKFIQNVYEQLGVTTNMEKAIEMYKDLC